MDGSNNNEIPGPARVHQSETKQNLIYSLLINTAEICMYGMNIDKSRNAFSMHFQCIWPFAGRTSSKTIDRLLEDYGAYEILDFIVTQLSRHPFLAFGMSMCVLSCALPFIVFMVFAIATVLMTFTGFVIIEGKFFNKQIETFSIEIYNLFLYRISHYDRHINYDRIGTSIWISWCSHIVLLILRFRDAGWLFWSNANLRYH